jgi:DNA-directed RNA polymerase subunit H (RpoH/RPB5)
MTSLNENTGIDLIFNSRKTILEMLKDRGYNIDNYSSYSKQEIITLYEKNSIKYTLTSEKGPLDILVENEDGKKLFVKYRLDDKFKKSKVLNQQILSIYNDVLKEDDDLIILYNKRDTFKNHMKDSNIEIIEDYFYQTYKHFVQIFGLENFLINITHHVITQKFEKINDSDKEKLLKQYHIKEENLPTIRRDDPPVKYYGYRPGDITRINRTNGYTTYRLVTVE